MKPFNLEKFLAGEPAITRDGRKVTDFHYFKERVVEYKLVCLLSSYLFKFYRSDGKTSESSQSEYDLFMEEKEVDLWVNVYCNDGVYTGGIHKSEQEAIGTRAMNTFFRGTHKITIKE
jgi:hypothetical protein